MHLPLKYVIDLKWDVTSFIYFDAVCRSLSRLHIYWTKIVSENLEIVQINKKMPWKNCSSGIYLKRGETPKKIFPEIFRTGKMSHRKFVAREKSGNLSYRKIVPPKICRTLTIGKFVAPENCLTGNLSQEQFSEICRTGKLSHRNVYPTR